MVYNDKTMSQHLNSVFFYHRGWDYSRPCHIGRAVQAVLSIYGRVAEFFDFKAFFATVPDYELMPKKKTIEVGGTYEQN